MNGRLCQKGLDKRELFMCARMDGHAVGLDVLNVSSCIYI